MPTPRTKNSIDINISFTPILGKYILHYSIAHLRNPWLLVTPPDHMVVVHHLLPPTFFSVLCLIWPSFPSLKLSAPPFPSTAQSQALALADRSQTEWLKTIKLCYLSVFEARWSQEIDSTFVWNQKKQFHFTTSWLQWLVRTLVFLAFQI